MVKIWGWKISQNKSQILTAYLLFLCQCGFVKKSLELSSLLLLTFFMNSKPRTGRFIKPEIHVEPDQKQMDIKEFARLYTSQSRNFRILFSSGLLLFAIAGTWTINQRDICNQQIRREISHLRKANAGEVKN